MRRHINSVTLNGLTESTRLVNGLGFMLDPLWGKILPFLNILRLMLKLHQERAFIDGIVNSMKVVDP